MGKVSIIWRLLPWRALQDKYTPCNIVKKRQKGQRQRKKGKKQRQNAKGRWQATCVDLLKSFFHPLYLERSLSPISETCFCNTFHQTNWKPLLSTTPIALVSVYSMNLWCQSGPFWFYFWNSPPEWDLYLLFASPSDLDFFFSPKPSFSYYKTKIYHLSFIELNIFLILYS